MKKELEFKIEDVTLHNGYILCEEYIVENKTAAGIILPSAKTEDNHNRLFKVLSIDIRAGLGTAENVTVKVDDIVSINGGYVTLIGSKPYTLIKQGNIIFSTKIK